MPARSRGGIGSSGPRTPQGAVAAASQKPAAHPKQVLTCLKLRGLNLGYLLDFGEALMNDEEDARIHRHIRVWRAVRPGVRAGVLHLPGESRECRRAAVHAQSDNSGMDYDVLHRGASGIASLGLRPRLWGPSAQFKNCSWWLRKLSVPRSIPLLRSLRSLRLMIPLSALTLGPPPITPNPHFSGDHSKPYRNSIISFLAFKLTKHPSFRDEATHYASPRSPGIMSESVVFSALTSNSPSFPKSALVS